MADETKQFNIRMPAALRERLVAVAERQSRTLTSQIFHYLRRGLMEDGHPPDVPAPVRYLRSCEGERPCFVEVEDAEEPPEGMTPVWAIPVLPFWEGEEV